MYVIASVLQSVNKCELDQMIHKGDLDRLLVLENE